MQQDDPRIVELESRLAFQDDAIQALNEIVIGQQRLLEQLRIQFVALASRQRELQSSLEDTGDEPPPPHY